jgi:hypothetical protein
MRVDPAFEEILEQRLQGVFFVELSPEACLPIDLDSLRAFSAPPLNELDRPLAGASAVVPATTPPVWYGALRPDPVRRSRASRALTPGERRALDELIAAGAHLSDGFTLPELRSSFRALALAYHPDRHASHACDTADLSARFARIADAYRVLVEAARRA